MMIGIILEIFSYLLLVKGSFFLTTSFYQETLPGQNQYFLFVLIYVLSSFYLLARKDPVSTRLMRAGLEGLMVLGLFEIYIIATTFSLDIIQQLKLPVVLSWLVTAVALSCFNRVFRHESESNDINQ